MSLGGAQPLLLCWVKVLPGGAARWSRSSGPGMRMGRDVAAVLAGKRAPAVSRSCLEVRWVSTATPTPVPGGGRKDRAGGRRGGTGVSSPHAVPRGCRRRCGDLGTPTGDPPDRSGVSCTAIGSSQRCPVSPFWWRAAERSGALNTGADSSGPQASGPQGARAYRQPSIVGDSSGDRRWLGRDSARANDLSQFLASAPRGEGSDRRQSQHRDCLDGVLWTPGTDLRRQSRTRFTSAAPRLRGSAGSVRDRDRHCGPTQH